MKRTLTFLARAYGVVGAIWLTFTIFSIFFFPSTTEHAVSGIVKEVVLSEWAGYPDDVLLIETTDGKGDVLASAYSKRIGVGDEVSLKIRTGGASGSYIFASIEDLPRKTTLKTDGDNGDITN